MSLLISSKGLKMPDTSLNIPKSVLDNMYCNHCKNIGAIKIITTDPREADLDEYNQVDDEWEIVVCSKCGWQELDYYDDIEE